MSNEERGQWVYLVAIVVTSGAYLVITLGQLGQTAPADIDYVPTMLWSIGIGIALAIVGRIGVEIVSRMSRAVSGLVRSQVPRTRRSRPTDRPGWAVPPL